MPAAKLGGRAAVMGAGMAGLLAARVLADHFDEVIIVERDRPPAGPEARMGVPQGRHARTLLGRGAEILHRLFPDLLHDLTEQGAAVIDAACDVRRFQEGTWRARFPSGIRLYCCSRLLLEWRVRVHLLRLPHVQIRAGDGVRSLRWNKTQSRVTGLRLDQGGLDADFVVDATGRGSRTPEWLETAGLGKVPLSAVRADVTYATRIYRRPAGGPDWRALMLLPSAPGRRLGSISPIEGDRWICTLAGYHGDTAPADDAGYLAYAGSLSAPDLHDAIADAEPLSEVFTFRAPVSLRRHYERMERFPDGLGVIGDAACLLNPIYGQGITAAALGAAALGEALTQPDPARGFQKRLAAALEAPWSTVATEDFRYRETKGDPAPGAALRRWYSARLHLLAATDEMLCRRLIEVEQMLRPASDLLATRTLRKALNARKNARQ